MRKLYIFSALMAVLLLSSCFSDKGNYDYKDPINIRIEGVQANYTVSPTGDRLQISPKVYPEDRQYDFFWLVVPSSASWNEQVDTISHQRDLNYKVNLSVGNYKLRLCATDRSTGVFAYEEYDLYVTTDMGIGWWVLKSENDSADIDFFSDTKTKPNIVQAANGHHLQGTGQNLYFTFNYWDFDESAQRDKRVNAVFVASSKDLAALDYFTGKIIRDYDHLFIEAPSRREVRDMFAGPSDVHVYVGDNIYTLFNSRYDVYKQFVIKTLGDYDISPIRHSGRSLPLLFNKKNSSFCSVSRTSASVNYFVDGTGPLSPKNMNIDLLFMGGSTTSAYNQGDVAMAIVKQKDTGKYSLLTLNGQPSTMDLNPIKTVESLDGSLNMLQADYRTLNQNNRIIYFAKDNKLYSCNLDNKVETAQDISWGANETITYMEFLKYSPYGFDSTWFDYLAVATTTNGNYKLYLYPVNAGKVQAAVKVLEGKGRVKRACFMSQTKTGIYTSTLF
ncbi:PKD-like family lipoprotein [Hoylesella enoeca]|nr:PKD-like family lipoprotein [Hoylesella enoeca]